MGNNPPVAKVLLGTLILQLSFRFQSRGALAIYHGEQGLLVDV